MGKGVDTQLGFSEAGLEEPELYKNTRILRKGAHRIRGRERREEDATEGQHHSLHTCV